MDAADLAELDTTLAALGVVLDDEIDDGLDLELSVPESWAPPSPPRRVPGTVEEHPEPTPVGWEPAPELDLPAPTAPPGYVLDRRGILRYAHDRSCVPGQQQVTLARLWRFERADGFVLVPNLWARTRAELRWALDVAEPHVPTQVGGATVAAHPVPEWAWELYARHALAVTAPELDARRMLTAHDVADLAGLTRSAIPTYLARGVLPPPQARVANSPMWSLPPLGVWLANRRDPGRPAAGT